MRLAIALLPGAALLFGCSADPSHNGAFQHRVKDWTIATERRLDALELSTSIQSKYALYTDSTKRLWKIDKTTGGTWRYEEFNSSHQGRPIMVEGWRSIGDFTQSWDDAQRLAKSLDAKIDAEIDAKINDAKLKTNFPEPE